MKSIRYILLAVVCSLLLTAGFAKAAESFDVVGTKSQVERVQGGTIPGLPCDVLN